MISKENIFESLSDAEEKFAFMEQAGLEIKQIYVAWKNEWEEEWQESKWSWFLKEECCEAQLQAKELNEIQAMLKQCAARSEASAPTDSTPNAPPGK